MPLKPINYNNTIIYKIVSKDITLTDSYIGHTTDLIKRKYKHKKACNNSNDNDYNNKVYKYIRNNGGWESFDVIMIEKYPCNDLNEAKRRERYYIESLKSTLNMTIPLRTDAEYYLDNKEKIKEQVKQYRIMHKEEIKIRTKEYREKNKEKIKARHSKIILCDTCMSKSTHQHTARHKRSLKHINAEKLLNEMKSIINTYKHAEIRT
jgi:hypothetical protein